MQFKHCISLNDRGRLLSVTDLEGDFEFLVQYLAKARQYYISNLGVELEKNDFCLVQKKKDGVLNQIEYIQLDEQTSFLNCGDLIDNTRASTKTNPSTKRSLYNNIRLLQIMVHTKEHYGDNRDRLYCWQS